MSGAPIGFKPTSMIVQGGEPCRTIVHPTALYAAPPPPSNDDSSHKLDANFKFEKTFPVFRLRRVIREQVCMWLGMIAVYTVNTAIYIVA